MTIFFLIRHATHALGDRILVGRMPGVPLAQTGRREAALIGERLAAEHITSIQTSPRERARETAAAIAARLRLPVAINDAVDEIDVGAWTGCSFDMLSGDERWTRWNTHRGTTRPPFGESMSELQRRVVGHLEAARRADPHGRIVLVSHAEPIRAAILHMLAAPLDDFASVEIAPASISRIAMDDHGAAVESLNERVAA